MIIDILGGLTIAFLVFIYFYGAFYICNALYNGAKEERLRKERKEKLDKERNSRDV